jgi:very-short-patch-repair endonuclease
MNLVIECDGNYWHKYPTGTDIDHIRTDELIDKGFKVLRLWEFEIKDMDINRFKNRLTMINENKKIGGIIDNA